MFDIGTILIDNNIDDGAYSYFYQKPIKIISAYNRSQIDSAFSQISEALANGLYLAGYFSYELGYYLDDAFANLPLPNDNGPLIWFGVYAKRQELSNQEVEALLEGVSNDAGFWISEARYSKSKEEYSTDFAKIHAEIEKGTIYQANLTFDAEFDFKGSPIALYSELRKKQMSRCGAFIQSDKTTILSRSPEIFFQKNGAKICTIPMKGTMRRSIDPSIDAANIKTLQSDEKQRAENLMIVDLLRNDLSKISEVGSVKVSELFSVQTYDTLHQMVSKINSKLKKDTNIANLVKSLFPCGSITGAPKISAMELIAQYENRTRGIYCGAIGHFSPNASASFNVAIRTAAVSTDRIKMGVGSGIIYDSIANEEYEECKLKANFLSNSMPDFSVFETLLWQRNVGFHNLNRHLKRLTKSVKALKRTIDKRELNELINEFAPNGDYEFARVKMEVKGTINLTSEEYVPSENEMVFIISPTIMRSNNPWLYHKTTVRQLYDDEWRDLCQSHGWDEIVYFNEKDQLTEGSRTNIFVKFGDGQLYTPPVNCGLLPGILRGRLIEEGRVKERIIYREEFKDIKEFYLGNSLRGLRKAILKCY